MADLRSIALAPVRPEWQGANNGINMLLEAAEPGFTVGSVYEMLGVVVDVAPATPKPYGVVFDDSGHMKVVDLGKLKLAPVGT